MLSLLSQEFDIIEPRLSWSNRAKNGLAYGMGQNRISCGPKCWRGVEDALLHEFTHILAWRKSGLSISQVGHTEFFWIMLEKVCMAWYNNPNKYNWDNEYKRGQIWHGKRKGRID